MKKLNKYCFVFLLSGILYALCYLSKVNADDFCSGRAMLKLYIESCEIDPMNVKQGDDFEQKLKCIYCSYSKIEPMQAKIRRRVLHNNKIIKETIELVKVETGENKYEAKIKVNKRTKTGIYYLETVIEYYGNKIERIDRFNVIAD